jgi:hypothetical protein
MPDRPLSLAILAALCALAFGVFAGALGNGFTNWDDDKYVLENAAIERLDAASVREMFEPASVHVGNWAPVTILSYAVDHAIWRKRPFGYHLTNVLLHAVCTALLFLLLRRLLGPGEGILPAAIAAALFAVHPVQVESVAWVAERKNVLGMALLLAAFLAWLRATRSGFRPVAYAGFLALFALSLMAKAQAVILPPLIALYEGIVRPRLARAGEGGEAALRGGPPPAVARGALLLPAFALAVALGLVAIRAQATSAEARPAGDLLGTFATAPVLLLAYVKDLFLPLNRSAVLVRPVLDRPWEPLALAAWLLVIAWVGGALALARRRPHAAFFSLWFLGALAPVLNFVPLPVLAADRYQYWAAPGLFALAGLLARRMLTDGDRRTCAAAAALIVVAIGLFSALTVARVRVWRDSIALWEDAVRKSPREVIARTNLSTALIRAGRSREAIEHLEAAIRERPRNAAFRLNLGVALLKEGDVDGAIREGLAATRVAPRYVNGWLLLGTALEMGARREEAVQAFREDLRLRPGDPAAQIHLRGLLAPGRGAGSPP